MTDELTDDKREQYAEEWEELDEKVILAQLLAEQQRTNMLLERALSDGTEEREDTPTYECKKCDATVQADERERHAMKQHKAGADMVGALFSES